ncbi:MAG: hypothetical protein J0L63_18135 [Anaerolineae bacterium]|nr:hypothetical protein [Anaerolineae bacterium]
MNFSKSIAKMAFHGYAINCYPILRVGGARFTQEHKDAINAVYDHYDDFCRFILSELSHWPLFERYFKHLVEVRLKQRSDILASDFISSLIDKTHNTEERLERIHNQVKNFASITKEIGIPEDPNKGSDTDEIVLDIWTEIFAIDLLLNDSRLGFSLIEKVIGDKAQPKVDLLAQLNGINYAIEITRIRKRDFEGSTFPKTFEAIYYPENLRILRNALRNKINDKNRQIAAFCKMQPDKCEKKLLVIKTSQWEYQDSNSVLHDETQKLLSTHNYPAIDEVIVIYDVNNFHWLK